MRTDGKDSTMNYSDRLTRSDAKPGDHFRSEGYFAFRAQMSAGLGGKARMATEQTRTTLSAIVFSAFGGRCIAGKTSRTISNAIETRHGLIKDDHEGSNMHRMRTSLICSLIAVSTAFASARADLIQPTLERSYPDIAADVNGVVQYTYNGSSGTFTMRNTPFLLATGPDAAQEFTILPTGEGIRRQSLSVALDSAGKFLDSNSNSYELYGTTTVDGQSFSGLLLQGKPINFGSKDNGAFDMFDLEINLTGGALADAFGDNAYILIRPELQSSFTGDFATNFSSQKATSNTRGSYTPVPPVPEPATWMILIGGGAGLAMFNRRRLRVAARDLD